MRSTSDPVGVGAIPALILQAAGSLVVRRRGKQRNRFGGCPRDTQRGREAGLNAKRHDGRRSNGPAASRHLPLAGVAPGPHHSLTNLIPDAIRAESLPKAGPLNVSPIQANGGVPRPGCLAYQLRQSGFPYSIDNRTDCIRQELPAGSSFFVRHAPKVWKERSNVSAVSTRKICTKPRAEKLPNE